MCGLIFPFTMFCSRDSIIENKENKGCGEKKAERTSIISAAGNHFNTSPTLFQIESGEEKNGFI